MNDKLFTRQFLLTKKPTKNLEGWKQSTIGEYNLYTHPKLETCQFAENNVELLLIGYFFDYEKPEATNLDILRDLVNEAFEPYIRHLDKYTGQFVLLRKDETSFTLISDAGAQREVYYNAEVSVLASQPKLMQLVDKGIPHSNKLADDFYKSAKFNKYRIYIGDTTQYNNIKHLKPNHYIDLSASNVIRFFPYKQKEENSFEFVVDESIKRITGFMNSMAKRYENVALPVTAGYDSRLLFAASQKIKCRYYIFRHRKLNDHHYDIYVPKKIFKHYPDYRFEEIIYDETPDEKSIKLHESSIDFPRTQNTALIFNGFGKNFSEYIVPDTIMSELARNRYGNFKKLNADDLSYLNHYYRNEFVTDEYQKWLNDSQDIILANGYHIPDLFYWEEVMGNWAAKSKTEYGLATEFFSLLNSRELIDLMMSVNIQYRQPNNNILYNTIIKKCSPQALSQPMNPSRRTSMQILMQKMGIFDIYRFVKIKLKV